MASRMTRSVSMPGLGVGDAAGALSDSDGFIEAPPLSPPGGNAFLTAVDAKLAKQFPDPARTGE